MLYRPPRLRSSQYLQTKLVFPCPQQMGKPRHSDCPAHVQWVRSVPPFALTSLHLSRTRGQSWCRQSWIWGQGCDPCSNPPVQGLVGGGGGVRPVSLVLTQPLCSLPSQTVLGTERVGGRAGCWKNLRTLPPHSGSNPLPSQPWLDAGAGQGGLRALFSLALTPLLCAPLGQGPQLDAGGTGAGGTLVAEALRSVPPTLASPCSPQGEAPNSVLGVFREGS